MSKLPIQKASAWAKKNWHFALLLTAILFLVFSPPLFYRLFHGDGKPVEVREHPPEETGGIRYNVEELKYWANNTQIYEEGETYAVWGWAFLDIGQKVALADFDRFVVIYNDKNAYIFSTQVYPRPGVQEAFPDLGLDDLTSAGFYAIVSRNALPKGTYQIGLLFRNKQDGSEYFAVTKKVLIRTPNHVRLESSISENKPAAALVVETPQADNGGMPLTMWEHAPEETGGIRYNVEGLKYWANNKPASEEGETYAVWGWTFLDIGQNVLLADYDRFVVLYDDATAYVFTTQVYPRPDVQDAFSDLGLTDLTSAGFYAVVSRNAIPSGKYNIGLLFEDKNDKSNRYFVRVTKNLVRTVDHMWLEIPSEGQTYAVWERAPEETGGIRYNIEELKYWADNKPASEEGETYAVWGWAFLDIGQNVLLSDYDRFVVLYDEANVFVFATQVYPRPDVQDAFSDLGLTDLTSAGLYAVVSRNALPSGEYAVGLLFENKQDAAVYFVKTNTILMRTPEHLSLETASK